MKTFGAAKVYWRRLNSRRSLPVLDWSSESEYFERFKFFCRYNIHCCYCAGTGSRIGLLPEPVMTFDPEN